MIVKIVNKSGYDSPSYATTGAAGMDLRAAVNSPVVLKPMERTLVGTGIFLEIPEGVEAQVRPRSGLAVRHGVTVLNSPGTIDSDYRGEVKVLLVNLSDEPFEIKPGERIAQMIFAGYVRVQLEDTDSLSSTERGAGGFGSTGTE